MPSFGIEGIRKFSHLHSSGAVSKADELTYTFNIGNGIQVSVRDLAERVIARTGSDSRIQFVPYEEAYAKGFQDMLRRKPIIDKLAAFTGFRPSTPLREIIRLTAEAA